MEPIRRLLFLAAFLEYPNLPKSKRNQLIDSTLDALGLANVQNRPIGDADPWPKI